MSEAGNNPLIFNICPEKIAVTARDIGIQLAADLSTKQAAIFAWMADEVGKYGPTESWHQQCREIAAALTDEECHAVASMLDTLVEHCQAIPVERRAERMSEGVLNKVDSLLTAVSEESKPQ